MMARHRQLIRFRVRLLTIAFCVAALMLVGRLYHVQVIEAAEYQLKAERQYVHTKQDIYSRGSIFFTTRDGELLSAASVRAGYVLAVNPQQVIDARAICDVVTEIITLDTETCIHRSTLPERTYVELDDEVSEEQYLVIQAAALPGVMLYRNNWRYYPGGTVAARTIGFVGYGDESSDLRGRFGLERMYDDVLFRQREVMSVNFFAELFSQVGSLVYRREGSVPGNVVTTLEPSVSRMLDGVLEKTQAQYQSRQTGAIIMDPQTGEIYAMNVVPTFDLNDRRGATIEQFRNPLVEDVFEFGSTIKALTVAAGLDSGAISAGSTYTDNGSITLNTFTIRNYDGRARGTVDMQQVLNQSLNTGVSHIVQKMKKERFREYFTAFLGGRTGIDLPSEVPGLLGNLQSPRDVEYATASFGQGIALTPVAATRALAALGNGGKLVTPHLVKEVRYEDGVVETVTLPTPPQVITPESSEEISRMLVRVVDEALKGGNVALPNYTIAAKTGTAQIADSAGGGYYEDKFLHSFFGYFPAYEPRFIVFMYTIEPQGVQYASETLTEPFMEIVRFLINYYSIPPDR